MKQRILLSVLLLNLLLSTAVYASGISRIPLTNPDNLQNQLIHFTPPQAQRVVLDNGIIIYIFEDHELPLLNISAVIRTGSNHDPVGKEGLADIMGTVMKTGGTLALSGDAIDDALEFIAGTLTVSMNRESGSFNLSILKKDFDEGLNIFSQILTNPLFEENKLKLSKNLKNEELRRIADDPQKLAFLEFKKLLYHNNPAGRFPSITSVNSIQRDDLIQFYKRFFYPENIMIAISGDISKEEAIAKIRQYLGAWNESKKYHDISPIPLKQKGQIYFLFKDIPQSIIISGQFAPGKKEPEAYPFDVLDFIVGSGGFRSHIFQEVRNNLGLAYSTGSFYSKKSEYGVFEAYAITGSESTAKVISIIRSIIKDVRTNEVDKNELEWAKKSINNNFIFSFISAEQIAYQQLMIEYEKLSTDYLTTYRDNIAKIQAEDLKKVAVKYLSPDDTVTLVVGNESTYNQLISTFGNVIKIESIL